MKIGKIIILAGFAAILSVGTDAQYKNNTGLLQQNISSLKTDLSYKFASNEDLKHRNKAILLGLGLTSIPAISNALVNSASQYQL